jgi:hypothetical protein
MEDRMDAENPFRAPDESHDRPRRTSFWPGLRPAAVWLGVFFANLPFCWLAGMIIAQSAGEPGGALGMYVGVAALFLLGLVATSLASEWMSQLRFGALFLAISQAFPLLQVVAGRIGLWFAARVGPLRIPGDGTVKLPVDPVLIQTQMFLATIVTGLILMGLSMILGIMVTQASSFWRRTPTSRQTD